MENGKFRPVPRRIETTILISSKLDNWLRREQRHNAKVDENLSNGSLLRNRPTWNIRWFLCTFFSLKSTARNMCFCARTFSRHLWALGQLGSTAWRREFSRHNENFNLPWNGSTIKILIQKRSPYVFLKFLPKRLGIFNHFYTPITWCFLH